MQREKAIKIVFQYSNGDHAILMHKNQIMNQSSVLASYLHTQLKNHKMIESVRIKFNSVDKTDCRNYW